jgi:hypothetical protein
MDESKWIEQVVTLFAVVIGAVLGYLTTRAAELRKERSEAAAKSTLLALKVRNIVDGIFRIDRELQEGIALAEKEGVDGPAWTKFVGIAGIERYEEVLTVEDMAILASHGYFDLIQALSELRDGQNGIVRALTEIYRQREQIAGLIVPTRMEGRVAIYDAALPPEAGPAVANLNMLSEDVLAQLVSLKQQARETIPVFNEKMRAAVKVANFPRISFPQDDQRLI